MIDYRTVDESLMLNDEQREPTLLRERERN